MDQNSRIAQDKTNISEYTVEYHVIAAIFVLVTSLAGTFFPLASKHFAPLNSSATFSVLSKCMGTGVILGVALVHMLEPGTLQIGEYWETNAPLAVKNNIPFFVCLFSIFLMHTIELIIGTFSEESGITVSREELVKGEAACLVSFHDHSEGCYGSVEADGSRLPTRRRNVNISALMMSFGTSFHSFLIGFALGYTNDSEVATLAIAFSLHQFFEGFSLGYKLSDSSITIRRQCLMAACFSISAPLSAFISIFAIHVLPQGSKIESFPLFQGVTDAFCAGILLYLGFEMLYRDFAFDMHRLVDEVGKPRLKVWMILLLWLGGGLMAAIGIII